MFYIGSQLRINNGLYLGIFLFDMDKDDFLYNISSLPTIYIRDMNLYMVIEDIYLDNYV